MTNPWMDLGARWLETMSASAIVVARRTRRQATPALLFHMGSEKMLVALQSSNAMLRNSLAWPSHPAAMGDAWARWLTAGLTPFHARVKRNARPRRR